MRTSLNLAIRHPLRQPFGHFFFTLTRSSVSQCLQVAFTFACDLDDVGVGRPEFESVFGDAHDNWIFLGELFEVGSGLGHKKSSPT